MEAKMTKAGRQQLCKAHAGDEELSKIAKIVFGSGGCTEGVPKTVTGEETELATQVIEKDVETHTFIEARGDGKMCERYGVTLKQEDIPDTKISEAGLVNEAGTLCAYITFLEKGKDADMELQFFIDEIF